MYERQDVRKCRQLVCVGDWWAASLFYYDCWVAIISLLRGRSGVIVTAISKGVPIFLAPSIFETRIHSLLTMREKSIAKMTGTADRLRFRAVSLSGPLLSGMIMYLVCKFRYRAHRRSAICWHNNAEGLAAERRTRRWLLKLGDRKSDAARKHPGPYLPTYLPTYLPGEPDNMQLNYAVKLVLVWYRNQPSALL